MRATTLFLTPLGLCLAASVVTAQTVDPIDFRNKEAYTQHNYPFGSSSNGGHRYLQIHDGLIGKKVTINQLAWRRDNDRPRYNAISFRVTMILSTAAVTFDKADTTFDNNHGANKQTVVNFAQVDWPATVPDQMPAPFEYAIKCNSPYSFDGTNGGLCWEVQLTQQNGVNQTMYFDATANSSTNPAMQVSAYGEGCYHSQWYQSMTATGTSSMNWNNKSGTLYLDGQRMAPNSIAIGILGFSRAQFAVFQLPFEFPGSRGTYSGPCYLNASIDIVIPTTTTSSRSARITFPLPADPGLDGAKIFGQYLVPDNGSTSALPFATSNGVQYQWVKPYPVPQCSRVYATSALQPTGSRTTNYGLVTQVR